MSIKLEQVKAFHQVTSKQEQKAREKLQKYSLTPIELARLEGQIKALNAENILLEALERDMSLHPDDTGLLLRNATRSILSIIERHSIARFEYPRASKERTTLQGELATRQRFYLHLEEIRRGK